MTMIESTKAAVQHAFRYPKGPKGLSIHPMSEDCLERVSQAAARVIVEACAAHAFDALEKLGEPTQALIVCDAVRALFKNENG